MIGDRQQLARLQCDLYRKYYHNVLNLLILSCFIILVLIAAIIYLILFQLPTPYYATTLSGQILPLTPIS